MAVRHEGSQCVPEDSWRKYTDQEETAIKRKTFPFKRARRINGIGLEGQPNGQNTMHLERKYYFYFRTGEGARNGDMV